ncbi:hypothetical protein FBUS_01131 [Fasciolopsis buskii]|uniref:Uncharacterized protein n=1 Tax=Fasciolopsis buskii TaxID=27845 RepID=A0A8E0RVD5_9TREM|nr:hypothetical protein FBUS_01131 [Fasciolopsis buski]
MTKTGAPLEADDAPHPISTGQNINGDVTNAPDLPYIVDDIKPIATKSNVVSAVPPAHGDHPTVPEYDQNGSVHAVRKLGATPVPGDKPMYKKKTNAKIPLPGFTDALLAGQARPKSSPIGFKKPLIKPNRVS